MCETSNLIVDIWHYSSEYDTIHTIVPDGCQDIILEQKNTESFSAFISPLAHSSYSTEIRMGKKLHGFRLAPGTTIEREALLDCIKQFNSFDLLHGDWLNEFCILNRTVKEILGCLRSDISSISQAAKRLGVSSRTLQRVVQKETKTTPHFWFSLARARRCARLMQSQMEFVDIAITTGYSDQSHMNREIKKWFGCTPLYLKTNQQLCSEINQIGYD